MSHPPFHLALPVRDLEAARTFYVDLLGCSAGRESATWIDFNFFGTPGHDASFSGRTPSRGHQSG